MNHLLLVAIGGAIGSAARYLTGQATLRWFGPAFPWGTLAVNIIGSLAIGIFAELIARRFDGSPELRLFILTGILGGFTTFSAFSLEVFAMTARGDYLWGRRLYPVFHRHIRRCGVCGTGIGTRFGLEGLKRISPWQA